MAIKSTGFHGNENLPPRARGSSLSGSERNPKARHTSETGGIERAAANSHGYRNPLQMYRTTAATMIEAE